MQNLSSWCVQFQWAHWYELRPFLHLCPCNQPNCSNNNLQFIGSNLYLNSCIWHKITVVLSCNLCRQLYILKKFSGYWIVNSWLRTLIGPKLVEMEKIIAARFSQITTWMRLTEIGMTTFTSFSANVCPIYCWYSDTSKL